MELKNSPISKISRYQRKIDAETQQCLNCERICKIKKDKLGFCRTRKNIDGEIHTIIYGCLPARSCNPIEKKPFYHFHPGTTAFTIGTYGCNFSCFWCQNHHLSHPKEKISELLEGCEFYPPKDFIKDAIKKGCEGISISFNEPTLLFEYSLEAIKIAKKKGLYTTYVSNGYMTELVLKDLIETGLDAINFDIKGDNEMVKKYCGTDIKKVWRNARIVKNHGIHLEITTLLIEDFNTEEKILKEIPQKISTELGENTPFHISRAFPRFKSKEHNFNSPTSVEILKHAYELAKDQGLNFVYLGNLYDKEYLNTICPNCGSTLIYRFPLGYIRNQLDKKGRCSKCGYPICII
ncbi:MAG: Cyclic pyranopterin monophosphate synthase [Promethearchaeota archaeon]|nr:MAG: Cyclic pyranopterin monophosphate synthase [Candidatus Lokiarchaeota archaeon]